MKWPDMLSTGECDRGRTWYHLYNAHGNLGFVQVGASPLSKPFMLPLMHTLAVHKQVTMK